MGAKHNFFSVAVVSSVVVAAWDWGPVRVARSSLWHSIVAIASAIVALLTVVFTVVVTLWELVPVIIDGGSAGLSWLIGSGGLSWLIGSGGLSWLILVIILRDVVFLLLWVVVISDLLPKLFKSPFWGG